MAVNYYCMWKTIDLAFPEAGQGRENDCLSIWVLHRFCVLMYTFDEISHCPSSVPILKKRSSSNGNVFLAQPWLPKKHQLHLCQQEQSQNSLRPIAFLGDKLARVPLPIHRSMFLTFLVLINTQGLCAIWPQVAAWQLSDLTPIRLTFRDPEAYIVIRSHNPKDYWRLRMAQPGPFEFTSLPTILTIL